MKFRSERDTLVEALATASRAVTSRASDDDRAERAAHRGGREPLTVVGTDLDLTVRVEVEAIGLDDGALVAPARLVADIVRSLEPGAVTFEGGDDEVEISAARLAFRGADLSGRGLPRACRPPARSSDGSRPRRWPRRCARWCGPLRTTTPGRCSPGCWWQPKEGAPGWSPPTRTAWPCRDLAGAGPLPEGTEQILVPARALTELQRLLPAAGAEGRRRGERGVLGERARRHLHRGRRPAHDPPARRALPRLPPAHPSGLPEPAARRAGKRCSMPCAGCDCSCGTTPPRSACPCAAGSVELTVVSQEVGHASEDVDADYEGEELTVAFNPSYLIDGVEAVLGDEVRARDRRRHQAGHGAGPGPRRLPLPAHAGPGVVATRTRHSRHPRCLRGHPTLWLTDFRCFVEAELQPEPRGPDRAPGPERRGQDLGPRGGGMAGDTALHPGRAAGRARAQRLRSRRGAGRSGGGRTRHLVEAEIPAEGPARIQVNRQPVRRRSAAGRGPQRHGLRSQRPGTRPGRSGGTTGAISTRCSSLATPGSTRS